VHGFETISVVDVRGDRWTYPYARMLGIRDGFLFVEAQTSLGDDPGAQAFIADGGPPAGTMVMSAISKIPLAELDRVNIGVSVDDETDEQSTTHQSLAGAGLLDSTGKVHPD